LSGGDFGQLGSGRPVIRHFDEIYLDSLFSLESSVISSRTYPVTEVIVPVKGTGGDTVAFIQYWLDGEEIAAELSQLDQFLITLGLILFGAGGLIFIIVFLYARSRILGLGVVLADRNASLERANSSLAMAARTSAIGSVSSHLFHGLKNPLAGLKAYLRVTGQDEEAIAIADRMQRLIDETLNLISEDTTTGVALSMDEFLELAKDRLQMDDQVIIDGSGSGELPSKKAQLALLILRNLVENAAEANADRPVKVRLQLNGSGFTAEVEDEGPGLPDPVKERLFEPVQSSKANGTGIGLAISSVIARHIPATLNLAKSDARGTIFRLQMPL
jgi:signal transduction histidine kinase